MPTAAQPPATPGAQQAASGYHFGNLHRAAKWYEHIPAFIRRTNGNGFFVNFCIRVNPFQVRSRNFVRRAAFTWPASFAFWGLGAGTFLIYFWEFPVLSSKIPFYGEKFNGGKTRHLFDKEKISQDGFWYE